MRLPLPSSVGPGGIFNFALASSASVTGLLTVSGSTLSGNSATLAAGLYNDGSATVTGNKSSRKVPENCP